MRVVPVNRSFTVDGNKVISTSEDAFTFVPSASVQFAFLTQNITWWKAIKIFNANNQMISLLANEDQDRAGVFTATTSRSVR
jgi:hypothetical protein